MRHAWTGVLVAAVVGLGCGGCGGQADRPGLIGPTLALDDVDLTRFRGTTPVLRLHAHELRVFPRQLGAFRIAQAEEAVLAGVRCELFTAGGPAPAAEPSPAEDPGHGVALLGDAARHVTAVSVHGLDCGVVRDGQRIAHLTADHAALSGTSGAVVLRDLVLERLPAGPVLRAGRAAWDPRTHALAVRGTYELRDGDGVQRGHGLELDLDRWADRRVR